MSENNTRLAQESVNVRSFATLAVVFGIVITFVTLIPMPPAGIGYVFAFVFGRGYMRSSSRSFPRAICLGMVCGCAALCGLLFLRATILSFLPHSLLFLAIGTAVSFWMGNVWECRKIAVQKGEPVRKAKKRIYAFSHGEIAVKKIGDTFFIGASPEEVELANARLAFSEQYCAERGWDKKKLTLNQVMEIRKQSGWKHPQNAVDTH